MALKDTWVDKENGIDDVDAEPINDIANAVIELENENGNISLALEEIINIQNSLIGGESV